MTDNVKVLILTRSPIASALVGHLREVSPRLAVEQRDVRSVEGNDGFWRGVEVLYTDGRVPQPEQAPDLRWVQGHFAGVEHFRDHPLLRSVILTTTSGIHATTLAEHVLMVMLAFTHRLRAMIDFQQRGEWAHGQWAELRPQELRGSTVGIVGYGSIGREVGRLARAFGMTVLAAKRDSGREADAGYRMTGLGDPAMEHVDRLFAASELHALLRECDFVVLAAPFTPETRGMIGAAELAAMKSSAILINIARGGLVDEPALVRALQNGTIAGAGLDVFATEPLPGDSPLWRMPNVLLSPHAAAVNEHYGGRAMELFAENLRRYLSGEPLLNVVDVNQGY